MRLGDWSDDLDAELDPQWSDVDEWLSDPLFAQIHELAQRIGRLRKTVNAQLASVANATSNFNYDQFVTNVQQLAAWTAQFNGLVQQFKNSPAYVEDARTAALLSNWGAFMQEWSRSIKQALVALPSQALDVVRDLLNDIVDHAGDVVRHTGWTVLKSAVPIGLLAVLLLAGVREAEKSSTVRAVTRRYTR